MSGLPERIGRVSLAGMTLGVLALGCSDRGPAPVREAPADSAAADSTAHLEGAHAPIRIEIVGVNLHVFENAVMQVHRLEGTVVPTIADTIVPLDDPDRFMIEVESGETFVGYDDLGVVMNGFTFRGGPIGSLEMAREEDEDERGRVELKGRLRSGMGMPFEIEGTPEPMPDGRIRIRTEAIQALEVSVGGLMHALGLEPADLMGGMEERGIAFDGDDLILDASRALPPPRMRGPIRSVEVQDRGLLLRFGPGRPPQPARYAPSRGAHYLAFRHGVIKIGRMTQYDSHLTIVDADPRDAFDFFGEHMNRQLAAGYSKMSEAGTLTMFVPDFDDMVRGVDLPRGSAPGGAPPADR